MLLRVSSRLISSLDANVLKRVFKLLDIQYPGRREEQFELYQSTLGMKELWDFNIPSQTPAQDYQ